MEIKVKKRDILFWIIGIIAIPVIFIVLISSFIRPRISELGPKNSSIGSCLPAFRDGGGPYYLPNSPFRSKLVPDQNNGRKLFVSGKLLNEDCSKSIASAVIDIWQADETGEYRDEWYRGQIKTDSEGNYSFETVIPKGYGEGTGYRPPHIHFKVFVDGKEIVTSQMFFQDVEGREGFNDEYIIPLNEKDGGFYGEYNIVLPDFE